MKTTKKIDAAFGLLVCVLGMLFCVVGAWIVSLFK